MVGPLAHIWPVWQCSDRPLVLKPAQLTANCSFRVFLWHELRYQVSSPNCSNSPINCNIGTDCTNSLMDFTSTALAALFCGWPEKYYKQEQEAQWLHTSIIIYLVNYCLRSFILFSWTGMSACVLWRMRCGFLGSRKSSPLSSGCGFGLWLMSDHQEASDVCNWPYPAVKEQLFVCQWISFQMWRAPGYGWFYSLIVVIVNLAVLADGTNGYIAD